MTNINGARFQETAWAKINLSLSILGKRSDGYHQLESLVVFADFGDELTLNSDGADDVPFQLNVTGPQACQIDGENLVETVGKEFIKTFSNSGYHLPSIGPVCLKKVLPVAAGVGGGSADAGALIRLFFRLLVEQGVDFSQFDVLKFASQFGADIPVCVNSEPAFMRGVGEIVDPIKTFPSIGLLLVNPGIAVSTGSVFQALDAPNYDENSSFKTEVVCALDFDFGSLADVINYMENVPNDLLKPALKIAPKISDVLAEISLLDGCLISRLSGSGATCFGLFESEENARHAAKHLKTRHPDWWIEGTLVRPSVEACGL